MNHSLAGLKIGSRKFFSHESDITKSWAEPVDSQLTGTGLSMTQKLSSDKYSSFLIP